MPRPPFRRRIGSPPPCDCFKPAGIPAHGLPEVILTLDEFEAFRLADYEGLYQEDVAERMGVSRQTIGRILEIARHKIADALVHGKALRIEGGAGVREGLRRFACGCGHEWEQPFGGGRPTGCPACGGAEFRRTDAQRGRGCGGHGAGRGRGRHGCCGGHREGRTDGSASGNPPPQE